MSKRITTRWYIGAWVAWLIAFIGLVLVMRASTSSTPPPPAVFLYGVMAVAGLIGLFTWVIALIKLGHLRAWGWFAVVAILQLIGLGIIGMVAYAVTGPEDGGPVVYRPTVT
jgi:hypothetical protein